MPDRAIEDMPQRVEQPLSHLVWGSDNKVMLNFQPAALAEAGTVNLPTLHIGDSRLNVYQPYAANSEIARLYEKNRPAIVRINTMDPKADATFSTSAGSGSIIDASGIIATGYHVVKSAGALRVQTADGKVYDASIVNVDAAKDQALIKINTKNPFAVFPTVTLADSTSSAQKNKDLIALGFPRNQESMHVSQLKSQDLIKLSSLKVQGGVLLGEDKDREIIRSSGPSQNGNSGGPVFDPVSGKQIGLVNMSDKNSTYITPVEDLHQFIARTRSKLGIKTLPSSAGAEKTQTLPTLPTWSGSPFAEYPGLAPKR